MKDWELKSLVGFLAVAHKETDKLIDSHKELSQM